MDQGATPPLVELPAPPSAPTDPDAWLGVLVLVVPVAVAVVAALTRAGSPLRWLFVGFAFAPIAWGAVADRPPRHPLATGAGLIGLGAVTVVVAYPVAKWRQAEAVTIDGVLACVAIGAAIGAVGAASLLLQVAARRVLRRGLVRLGSSWAPFDRWLVARPSRFFAVNVLAVPSFAGVLFAAMYFTGASEAGGDIVASTAQGAMAAAVTGWVTGALGVRAGLLDRRRARRLVGLGVAVWAVAFGWPGLPAQLWPPVTFAWLVVVARAPVGEPA